MVKIWLTVWFWIQILPVQCIQYLRSENMNIIIYNDITSLRVIKHWILENLSSIQVLLSVISDSALFSSVVQFWVPDRGHFPWAVETGSEHQSNGGIHDHPIYPPQNEKKRYSPSQNYSESPNCDMWWSKPSCISHDYLLVFHL